jgi:hypothetical protein
VRVAGDQAVPSGALLMGGSGGGGGGGAGAGDGEGLPGGDMGGKPGSRDLTELHAEIRSIVGQSIRLHDSA